MVTEDAENSRFETPAKKTGAAAVLLFTASLCPGQPQGRRIKT